MGDAGWLEPVDSATSCTSENCPPEEKSHPLVKVHGFLLLGFGQPFFDHFFLSTALCPGILGTHSFGVPCSKLQMVTFRSRPLGAAHKHRTAPRAPQGITTAGAGRAREMKMRPIVVDRAHTGPADALEPIPH